MTVDEFRQELLNEMAASQKAAGGFMDAIFAEWAGEALESAGELDSFQLCNFSDVRGRRRFDGYSFDEADDSLMVCVADWSGLSKVESLTQTDARTRFKQLVSFLEAVASGNFVQFLDVGDPAYDFALTFQEKRKSTIKIRAYLVSDSQLSARVKDWPEGEVSGIPLEFHIWDIGRFFSAAESRSGLDEVEVSFEHLDGGGLPCLRAGLGVAEYEGLLSVLPALELAKIYERYGSRLLEGNVRAFLSAKGKVNQGIRRTIISDHKMFFAYNNGISCVATDVQLTGGGDALRIRAIKNLQIVNGGQTTASIFNVYREASAELLRESFVPMKLSIVQGEQFSSLMKDISLYANSQNKVTDADLASNDPFQIRFEEMSRRIQAPSVGGAQYGTYWYYERARGQYANEFYKLSPKQRDLQKLLNPKSQLITKLDLARTVLSTRQMPYLVALGSQRMIMEFSKDVKNGWGQDRQQYNDQYFRDRVAESILYRTFEASLVRQDWYVVGFKAIIAAYSFARLWRFMDELGVSVDRSQIWRTQEAPRAAIAALLHIGEIVYGAMNRLMDGRNANLTQLAKRQTCWEDVKSVAVTVSDIASFTISRQEIEPERREARKLRAVDDGIEAQQVVIELGSEFWAALLTWLDSRGSVASTDRSALRVASTADNLPSEKQAQRLLALKAFSESNGFFATSK